ncbi:MAG: hypothetical protein FJ302_01940 [Planctomycetes bacterium]|nr:hypothetical protein [Planctomycetota bacterium]
MDDAHHNKRCRVEQRGRAGRRYAHAAVRQSAQGADVCQRTRLLQ